METFELNRLPQPTWRHLRVNSKQFACPELATAAAQWTFPQECAAVLTAESTAGKRTGGLGPDILKIIPAGELLSLPAGTSCEEAIIVTLDAAEAAYSVTIHAEESSDYKIIIMLHGEGSGTHLLRVTADVEKNAALSISVAQLFGSGMTSLQDLSAEIGDHAALTVTQL